MSLLLSFRYALGPTLYSALSHFPVRLAPLCRLSGWSPETANTGLSLSLFGFQYLLPHATFYKCLESWVEAPETARLCFRCLRLGPRPFFLHWLIGRLVPHPLPWYHRTSHPPFCRASSLLRPRALPQGLRTPLQSWSRSRALPLPFPVRPLPVVMAHRRASSSSLYPLTLHPSSGIPYRPLTSPS